MEAFEAKGLPESQNGVAKLLGRSHSSVARWYHGEGLPELATCRKLAVKGGVSVDWLLTGRKPKYPISADPMLSRIMEVCIDLDQSGRAEVLRFARRLKERDQGRR